MSVLTSVHLDRLILEIILIVLSKIVAIVTSQATIVDVRHSRTRNLLLPRLILGKQHRGMLDLRLDLRNGSQLLELFDIAIVLDK